MGTLSDPSESIYIDPDFPETVYARLTPKMLFATRRTATDKKGKPIWYRVKGNETGGTWTRCDDPIFKNCLNRRLEEQEIAIGDEWEREQEIASVWDRFRVSQKAFEPQSSVVEGLIPENAITLLSGWRGAWKTWFALALSKAICRGSDFLGRRTEMMRVLYLNRDNPRKQFMTRLRTLDLTAGEPNFGLWNLRSETGPPPKLDTETEEDKIDEYEEIVEKCSPVMLIFDSLQRFHSGDENSTKDMAALFERFRRLTTLGATVSVLHNTGRKERERPRGAVAIEDGTDMLLSLRASGSPSSPGGVSLLLEIVRDKFGGRNGEKLLLKPSIPEGGDSEQLFTVLKSKPKTEHRDRDDLSERILAVLARHPEGISGRRIFEAVGGKTAKVYEELERLREEELVLTEPGPKRAVIYNLPREG